VEVSIGFWSDQCPFASPKIAQVSPKASLKILEDDYVFGSPDNSVHQVTIHSQGSGNRFRCFVPCQMDFCHLKKAHAIDSPGCEKSVKSEISHLFSLFTQPSIPLPAFLWSDCSLLSLCPGATINPEPDLSHEFDARQKAVQSHRLSGIHPLIPARH
jgi:hypothetical protein